MPDQGGIEREEEAAALAGIGCRAEGVNADKKGIDLGAGGRSRSRRVIGAVFAHRGTLAAFRHAIKWRWQALRAMAARNALFGEQVVGLERLSRGGEPFGAGRDAPLAALVDRQLD